MMVLVVLLAVVGMVRAGCDNQCSGHGTCGLNGVCTCYDNWGLGMSHDSGDCSERICPFEFSWVDTPDETGAHHKYTECASKGICDRESGQCECFAGYEGKACQRTSCPNDCSGHGQCEYIENMGFKHGTWDFQDAAMNNDWVTTPSDPSFHSDKVTLAYRYWDKTKTRGCVCDPEWADVDCSKRMCPYGNDVMDHRQDMNNEREHHVQIIEFETVAGATITSANTDQIADRTFALTFTSKLNETFTTIPITFKGYPLAGSLNSDQYNGFTAAIESALESLPNEVIDEVKVTMVPPESNTAKMSINITFTGTHVQGTQNLLKVQMHTCGDGCTPKLDGLTLLYSSHMVKEAPATDTAALTHHSADFNSYECGRRGKCDYDSGVCECFEGYTGIACNTITALV